MKRSLLAIKRSYVKLVVIELILIATFFVLFNIDSIYRIYLMVGVQLIGIFLIKLAVGYEKNRNRYTVDMCINMFLFTMLYQIIIYVIGMFTSFLKSGYSMNFFNILENTIPIILLIISSEILRYSLSRKGEKSNLILTIICILFVLIDINISLHMFDISSKSEIVRLISMIIIPSISGNILLTYSAKNFGFLPGIIYRLIKEIPLFIIPVIPNLGDYIYAIFNLLVPLIILFILYKDHIKRSAQKIVINNKVNRIATIIIVIMAAIVVIITSGVFKYYGLSIVSNSMNPAISRGDMVIVNKLNDQEIEKLAIGDILVYNKDDIVIVHRIVEISEVSGGTVYTTKGDNNETNDSWYVDKSKIIGKVDFKIKFIGYPAVLLNEFINVGGD